MTQSTPSLDENKKPLGTHRQSSTLFKDAHAFSGFSVSDLNQAKEFYGETLGLDVLHSGGMLQIRLATGATVLVYPKANHLPATFTILNFPVKDIEEAVEDLKSRGIEMEHYSGEVKTDALGIFHGGGPLIAWFKDPFGNIISVLEERNSNS